MNRRTSRLVAALAVAGLVLAACGDDDDDSSGTDAPVATDATDATSGATEATLAPADTEPASTDAPEETDAPEGTEATETTAGEDGGDAGSGWTVNTDDCTDPDAANAPIEGTVNIATAMPLSGGAAAAVFAPVAQGFQAYIDYANENGLLPDYEIALDVQDDQYNASLTPGAVNTALDSGAHLFSGIIGTPNNEAVRDTLNEECVPQLLANSGSPAWGEVVDYPWTTGILTPYDIESKAYAEDMAVEFPDGATVAVFYVNNDFGQIYKDAFEGLAEEGGFEIVDTQTIETADSNPPAAQVASIAGNAPDVIMAVPLGGQCPTFMSELANAKAANAGWEPRVYITSTCASELILGVAGPAADGLFTSASSGLMDIGNPEIQTSVPSVSDYIAYMEGKGLGDIITTGAAGWNLGEVTVEILREAAASPEGLTPANIMNISRSLEFSPSLVREGVVYKMAGEEDAYYAEDVQVVQYDATAKIFNDIGELNTSFRSS